MYKKIPKTEVAVIEICLDKQTEDDITVTVKHDDFFKNDMLKIAQSHNSEIKKEGLEFTAKMRISSLPFFIKSMKIFEKRWPNLLKIKFEHKKNI